MSQAALDTHRAEAFAGQMLGVFNDAMLALMVSIGHRTRLFDVLAELPPSTSSDIAAAAGLDERYVREWLGAVVTGRIVDYDGARGTYALPAEHAAFVTRAAGPDNLAMMTQYVSMLGQVEDDVIQCFHRGGGVPYSAFERFQALQREESAQNFDATLLDTVVPLVPGLPERLRDGIDVLDVGCGAGHALVLLGRAFPASRFVGYDISEEALALGRAEAAEAGLTNVRFEKRDVARLDAEAEFDFVTAFDTIHDQADPARVLEGVARILRPDGAFLCVDIAASSHLADNVDHPLGPALYAVSTLHCMTVSLAQDGAGLGTVWGRETAVRMFAEAGFRSVETRSVPGDILNHYYVCRRDDSTG